MGIKMKTIYVICHTWRDIEMTIEHFYTAEETVKRLSDLLSDEFGKEASPDDDPLDYLGSFYDWVSNEAYGMQKVNVEMKIIEIV